MRSARCLLPLAMCMLVPLTSLAQWEPEVRLTDNPFESVTCFNNAKCVATEGDIIHVVWHDGRDGNTEIYYKRSMDNGESWGPDTRLTTDGSWSECPAVAVSGTIIHVVWYDGRLGAPRIFYKRSLDGGDTWGEDVCLTPTSGVGYHPSIVVNGAIVHVAWADFITGPQIWYTRSLDNGDTWEEARNITPDAPPAGKNLASIAVSGSTVHVTWMDTRSVPQIYYTRSLDDGVTWEPGRPITPAPSQFASVAVSGDIVHVAYADFRQGDAYPQVYYTRSLDSGVNWETEVPLAEAVASWYPSVAVGGSSVHVVWLDNRNGDPADVYYKGSLDDGVDWGPEARLTDNPSQSREPSVALSASYVHVVFHDDRDGNLEVYYKRGLRDVVGVGDDGNPMSAAPRLLFAVPNPSPGPVAIRYDLPSAGPVQLEIFDASGALVRRFLQESQSGRREIQWDGRDGLGRSVPSGVYVTRIETDGRVMKGRVVLAR